MHKISVYNVYAVALLMALGAAILSGVFLDQAFRAQQAEREAAQQDMGLGQARAIQSLILSQLARMQTSSDGNLHQFQLKTAPLSTDVFNDDVVISNLNSTIFGDWVPQVFATNQLNGFGLTLMYPPNTVNVTFDRSFQVYADSLLDGSRQYMYAYTYNDDDLLHAFETLWSQNQDPVLPTLGAVLYNYTWFEFTVDSFLYDDFFDVAKPWASSDGNSYWYFTHQRAFSLRGIHAYVQTWDDAIHWRDSMLEVRVNHSEFAIFDSNAMLLATTNAAEATRIAQCHAAFSQGVVPTDCISTPASEYPIPEIRDVYRALLQDPAFANLSAPAVPLRTQKFFLGGSAYLGVSGTLFSQDRLRMTVVWYQPWTQEQGNITGLNALICSLTLLSTVVLTFLGIFGVLRPLLRIGNDMRAVASSLRENRAENAVVQGRKLSPFLEVDRIGEDFETIVVDFLGFSSHATRDNRFAPTDASRPFAIIFTDIESSTRLWGADPVEMSRCLQAHHEIIRELIEEHRLYEVKTVGDSFMVATASAAAALRFALELQERLMAFPWDWEGAAECYNATHIAEAERARRLWNGLRVRVGIHYGHGEIVHDEVTKGYDYYGSVVNTAARIEAVGHGGQVLVSEDVLSALASPLDATAFVAQPLGVCPLRGVATPPALVQLLPAGLAGRRFPPPRLEAPAGDDGDRKSELDSEKVLPSSRSEVYTSQGPSMRTPAVAALAEDFAQSHSLVRSGAVAAESVARQLLLVGATMEDLLRPLNAGQRNTTLKALFSGWGVSAPRGERDFSVRILQVALRLLENPRALAQLRSGRRQGTSDVLQLHASADDLAECRV